MDKDKKFSMFAFSKEESRANLKQKNDTLNIIWLDVNELLDNPKNSYNLSDIPSLAAGLAITDDMPPLRAKKTENGQYMLLSGHRRKHAILYGLGHGLEYRHGSKVPVKIVDLSSKVSITENDSEENFLNEDDYEILEIVLPNSGQRKMTPLEEAKQLKMLEPVIRKMYRYARENNGLKSKFRSFMAGIVNMSETTMERKLSLNELNDKIKELLDKGMISPTTAVNIAKLPDERQKELIGDFPDGKIKLQDIKEREKEKTPDNVTEAELEKRGQEKLIPDDLNNINKSDDKENGSQTDLHGFYKEKYINKIKLNLPIKYKTTIEILWVYDEQKQRYAVGEKHQTSACGGVYSPSSEDATFKTLYEAKEYIISYLSEFHELEEALKNCRDGWVQEIITKFDLFPYEPECREISPEFKEKGSSKNEVYNQLLEKMKNCVYENLEPCEQCKIATACQNCCKTCSEPCNCQQDCRKEEAERESCENIEVDDESHIAKFDSKEAIQRQIDCLKFVFELLSAEWRKVKGKEYESKATGLIRQDAAHYIQKILDEIQQEETRLEHDIKHV